MGKCRYRDEHGKTCTKCDVYKPNTEYAKGTTSSDGLASWCRACVKIASAEHSAAKKAGTLEVRIDPLATGEKRCARCEEVQPLTRFSWIPSRGFYHSWCRDCCNSYERGRRNALNALNGVFERTKPEGYTYTHKGYVMIKATGHHRADKNGWTYQHILVAEEKYGIKVTRDFTTHHKNGNRADNRPSNLELRVGLHGKHVDAVDGLLESEELRACAAEVLRRYGYTVLPPRKAVKSVREELPGQLGLLEAG